jgi:Ni,Fe-hydrogenase III component G
VLCAITGLDEGQNLSVVYHLAKDDGTVLNLKTSVDKNNPVIRTITDSFSSAEVYERELVDLLGFKVEGLSKGNRYPLTDDWPKDEYPLRKDWKPKV